MTFWLQELAGKNNEMLREVGKVKIDLNQQINRLQAEHQSQSDLLERIARLDKQLAGTSTDINWKIV